MKKKLVDEYLNEVNYRKLNSGKYIPSQFALKFINFISLLSSDTAQENKTPPMHLAMLDKLSVNKPHQRIVNLCARGTAKTSLFMEYLFLYLAVFKALPYFPNISSAMYVADSIDNGVKSARKSLELRYNSSEKIQKLLPKAHFTETYIEFENLNNGKFGIKLVGAKSGLRGTKILGIRPQIAVLDDLIGDMDAKSKTAMEDIRTTINSGISPAVHPHKHKIILNGTPFNKEDIAYQAIESGAWEVNVWPICEKFPCEKKEFSGAWEDRFPYEYVLNQYKLHDMQGTLNSFFQELMLRITDEKRRLVLDSDVKWCERKNILDNKDNYNFYITTDFATSSKQTADFSVLSVWAYDINENWIWVDGICKRQSAVQTLQDLFSLCDKYKPQSVGIEVSGQQRASYDFFIKEMKNKNRYYNLAGNNASGGIRPTQDKLSRFNLVVPLFKNGKIFFAEELKDEPVLLEFMNQIRSVTLDGIKGKDDCLDTISMLQYFLAIKPVIKKQEKMKNFPSVNPYYKAQPLNLDNNPYIV